MKKRLACFIFAAAMVLSIPAAAFATEAPALPQDPIGTEANMGGEVSVMSVVSNTISTDRLSNASGKVTAYAAFSSNATRSVCTISLQEKYNGSWRGATGLGTTSYTKTAYNCNSISAGKTFTLISGKTYRAKVIFTHVINGTTSTKTVYSGAF